MAKAARNEWRRRLILRNASEFYWEEDPPEGFKVGDRADFLADGRRYVRSINGRNINIDEVGANFRHYVTPLDHRPKRKRAKPVAVRSRWGLDVRGQCEAHGISVQTYYNRRHRGMDHDFALKATQAEALEWRRDAKMNAVADGQALGDEWRNAARWMAATNMDKTLTPTGRLKFAQLRKAGYSPKAAILHRDGKMDAALRKRYQPQVITGAKTLSDAMPQIQQLLSAGADNPGVVLAARLLGAINLMATCEKPTAAVNTDSVYGNLVLTILASADNK